MESEKKEVEKTQEGARDKPAGGGGIKEPEASETVLFFSSFSVVLAV